MFSLVIHANAYIILNVINLQKKKQSALELLAPMEGFDTKQIEMLKATLKIIMDSHLEKDQPRAVAVQPGALCVGINCALTNCLQIS